MSKGWALGSEQFKEKLVENTISTNLEGIEEKEEVERLQWSKELRKLKKVLEGKNQKNERKSADWKVAIATELKRTTSASNRWLSEELKMGTPYAVSRLVKECREGIRATEIYKTLISKRKA